MAKKVNITIEQGADFQQTVTLQDRNGADMNVEGYTANAAVRKSHASVNSVAFDCVLTTGQLVLSMSPNTTLDIVPGRYVYDVRLTKDDDAYRIMEGLVDVTPAVTKA